MNEVWIRDILVLTLPVAALGIAGWAGAVVVLEGRARRALQEQTSGIRARATATLRAVPHGLLILHGETVIAANPWLCGLLRRERGTLVGLTAPFPFIAPEHAHEFDAWLERLLDTGKADGDVVLCTPDGDRIVADMAGAQLHRHGAPSQYVIAIRNVTDERRRLDALADMVTHEPATGLLNVRGLQACLLEEVRRANEGEQPLSIALLELEQLQSSPDDAELGFVAAAQRLRGTVRRSEELARTRRRELVWVMPATDAAGAVAAVERIRESVFAQPIAGTPFVVTAGVCDLSQADDVPMLYALADRALAGARARLHGGTVAFSADAPLPQRCPVVADDLVPSDV